MQPHRRAGKAALLRHGEKRLELIQFHEAPPKERAVEIISKEDAASTIGDYYISNSNRFPKKNNFALYRRCETLKLASEASPAGKHMSLKSPVFFDTTLRDGEQSPGCSMTTQEKLTMAHALEDLGVDIIEAGFAMASEGDFAAIATITQAIRKPRIASLARAKKEDIEMAARACSLPTAPASTSSSPPATCTSNTSSRSAAPRRST
jgi:hypothetical protein